MRGYLKNQEFESCVNQTCATLVSDLSLVSSTARQSYRIAFLGISSERASLLSTFTRRPKCSKPCDVAFTSGLQKL